MSKIKIMIVFVLTFMLGALYVKGINKSYKVGDKVTYNEVDYYVIEDSDEKNDTVKLLKTEPLTVAEVNQYGAGHVNMYVTDDTSSSYYQQANDSNGYGGLAYYSSLACGLNGSEWVSDGCTTDYEQSEIKYVVDAWKTAQAPQAIEARLMTYDELMENVEKRQICTGSCYDGTGLKYDWLYDSNYIYWAMGTYNDSTSHVWTIYTTGAVGPYEVNYYNIAVRPVIVLSKTQIETNNSVIADNNNIEEENEDNNTEITKVDVPNTLLKEPFLSTIVGGAILIVSIIVCIVIINKKKDNI